MRRSFQGKELIYHLTCAHGFRYYPTDIEMYQYDNGFKLDKKMNNWEHL